MTELLPKRNVCGLIRCLAFALWLSLPTLSLASTPQIVLSEFLADNQSGLQDDNLEFSDWIELRNLSGDTVDLRGWHLTDDPANLAKWTFASATLSADEYLVVFASGKDRQPTNGARHTNFRLASGGGYLALVRPDGSTIEHAYPDYPAQKPDISFGVAAQTSEGVTTAYLIPPTPGTANSLKSVTNFVADVQFSVKRGFYETPFDLELLCTTPRAEIRYTTNGSLPTLANGLIYSGAIHIDHTLPVRAAAYLDGGEPSDLATHTFIFLNDVIRQDRAATLAAGFPASWTTTTPDYGMDQRVIGANDNYGGKYALTIQADLKSVPTLSLVTAFTNLFGSKGIYSYPENKGDLWERPVSLELIDPNGEKGFHIDAGLRIQGGAFRSFGLTKKKSFRLFFRQAYGHGKLRFPFFGAQAADAFDTLVLRANNNDGWQWGDAGAQPLYIRDAFALDTARAMGMTASHRSFAHVYINGVYWGLYNPVERPDSSFSSSYLGGDEADWDGINYDSATDGTYEAWNRMCALARKGLADNANYQKIQGNDPDGTRNPAYENLLDVDNLIDYMILNCYLGNNDWPDRNWYAGRDRVNGDGFKFYPWDSEWIVGLDSDVNTDKTGVSSASTPAEPYAACKKNAEFRLRFADRVYRYFFNGGPLYVDSSNPKYDPAHPERNVPAARFAAACDEVYAAVVAESARWGDQHVTSKPYTRDEHWAKEKTNQLTQYFPTRSSVVLAQFRRAGLYPNTDAPDFSQAGGAVPRGFALEMSAPRGTIYYTTDGADPRTAAQITEVSRITLVAGAAAKKVFVPTAANGGNQLGVSWQGGNEPFDDQAWISGSGGVGYDHETTYRPYLQTDLGTVMDNVNTTAFIRIPFALDGAHLSHLNFMTLRMQYDDGFAAYLNGRLIASANTPVSPQWNSVATAQNSDSAAVEFAEFTADTSVATLREGANILAIQGLNLSLSSSDFLIGAELVAGERQSTGGTSAGQAYTNAIILTNLTTIKARALNGAEWSALREATFVVGSPRLAISEIHYHPAAANAAEQAAGFSNADDFEFIELGNFGDASADLRGIHLAGAIQFDFSTSAVSRLDPNQYVLVVKNPNAFALRYGTHLTVAGAYTGKLSNGGETLSLASANQTNLESITYGTRSPWPETADGSGASLEIIDPLADPNVAANWQASATAGGSPGVLPGMPNLAVSATGLENGEFWLRFTGQVGTTYSVKNRATLTSGAWQTYLQTQALSNGPVEIRIPVASANQFFQITSP
jgi:hypothetical protein